MTTFVGGRLSWRFVLATKVPPISLDNRVESPSM